MEAPILNVKDLWIQYDTQDYCAKAVNGVSFDLCQGETIGIVGETGAGKTTTALSIMGLLPAETAKITHGEILFHGKDMLQFSKEEMRKIRGKEISMIYQDPMTSLNPIMTVGDQIAEGITYHTQLSAVEVAQKVDEILELVGIPAKRKNEYAHQLSGGMKQRIVIAMALACNPTILIADEPTTALDVTIQAQVLEMMNGIKSKLGTSLIFITHDLGIIVRMCDKVGIMYAGEIIEYGTTREIYQNYKHPYTKGLFGSIPSLTKKTERLSPVMGVIADSANLPEGCKFHPRCEYCLDICKSVSPPISFLSETHQVKCHLVKGEFNE